MSSAEIGKEVKRISLSNSFSDDQSFALSTKESEMLNQSRDENNRECFRVLNEFVVFVKCVCRCRIFCS